MNNVTKSAVLIAAFLAFVLLELEMRFSAPFRVILYLAWSLGLVYAGSKWLKFREGFDADAALTVATQNHGFLSIPILTRSGWPTTDAQRALDKLLQEGHVMIFYPEYVTPEYVRKGIQHHTVTWGQIIFYAPGHGQGFKDLKDLLEAGEGIIRRLEATQMDPMTKGEFEVLQAGFRPDFDPKTESPDKLMEVVDHVGALRVMADRLGINVK